MSKTDTALLLLIGIGILLLIGNTATGRRHGHRPPESTSVGPPPPPPPPPPPVPGRSDKLLEAGRYLSDAAEIYLHNPRSANARAILMEARRNWRRTVDG